MPRDGFQTKTGIMQKKYLPRYAARIGKPLLMDYISVTYPICFNLKYKIYKILVTK